MRAMILHTAPGVPVLDDVPEPEPGPGEVRLAVEACGLCRTDLHIVDGELPQARLPRILGHQIVGIVEAVGPGVRGLAPGTRVGVPWLGGTCGTCGFCASERENLCDAPVFTGCTVDGGFAEAAVARADFCLPLPDELDAVAAAPLLCAGLIGYRAYRMAGTARRIGLYGFGSAAHLLCQVAVFEEREVYAFTRPGDADGQALARSLGATWAGGSDETPPVPLEAALIFAPVGSLVPVALRAVEKGGVVVCAGIHMSDIPSFPYRDLWEERRLRSVANLTRADGRAFLDVAARGSVRAHTSVLPLEDLPRALDRLRAGEVTGSLVLVPR
jgi:propanol-preferring alcohol dehydrogenase